MGVYAPRCVNPVEEVLDSAPTSDTTAIASANVIHPPQEVSRKCVNVRATSVEISRRGNIVASAASADVVRPRKYGKPRKYGNIHATSVENPDEEACFPSEDKFYVKT